MLKKLYPYLKIRYLLYFFSFIAGWPCVFYLMGWLPHYTINYLILFGVALIYVLVKNRYRTPKPIVLLIFAQCVVWVIYSIIHGFDTSYYTRILMLLITYLFLEIQISSGHHEFIKTYNVWLVFQAIAGTIGIVLVLGNILHPILEFREMDMRPGYFFGLFTTNTYLDGLVRNAGFFDEPGALAFWGIYALLLNKLFVNNRKVELLLIFGLLSTLSLAYFIQLTLYLCFFYSNNWKKAIVYMLVFFVAIKLLASFNDQMDAAIFGRIAYNKETGTIQGDNRSPLMDMCLDIFKTSPLIGKGAENLIAISAQTQKFVGANAFTTLASDGIIGQIIILSPFFYLLALSRKDKRFGWAFVILITGFLQRPYDGTQLLYPLMSFSLILQASMSSDINRINYNIRNGCKCQKSLA